MKKSFILLLVSSCLISFHACEFFSSDTKTTAEQASLETSGGIEASDANNPESSVSDPSSISEVAPAAISRLPQFEERANSLPKTSIEFVGDTYDFGNVPEGTQVTHQFRFKNTGSNPIYITRVKPSCGCTTPTYSEEAVAPGGEGFIDITFNSEGRVGTQVKSILITGNFEGKINRTLKLKGEVEAQSKE